MQPELNAPTYTVTLTGAAYGGDAIGRLPDGRAVFVPFGIPGEAVEIRLVEQKPRYSRGEIVEFVRVSPDRIVPRCAHFSICGGCHYQHISYERQLALKTDILRDQLERIGGLNDPPLDPMVPSPRPYYYRNQVQFHLTPAGELGYYQAGSHVTFPVRECHLPEEEINDIWPQLDMEFIPGLERVGLRVGVGKDVMLVFEASNPDLPQLNIEGLDVSAVFLIDGLTQVLAGNSSVVMEVKERSFRVSAGSFFQINSGLVEAMVDTVVDWVSTQNPDTLLEVYAGSGLFSAFLAPQLEHLTAIESDPGAGEDFVYNLDEFDHVDLYQGVAEEIMPWLEVTPDTILVDPPRAGLGEKIVRRVAELSPASLVYVSCDPATLARDGRYLASQGYHLARIKPFDVFPQTYHIESISLWKREDRG